MRTVRYAIVGFGNVGTALARHVAGRRQRVAADYGLDFRLVGVADSGGTVVDPDGLDAEALVDWKESGLPLSAWDGAGPTATPAEFLSQVDCLVECLPTSFATGEPGLSWARAALAAGADVVFADKGPLVVALPELEAEARQLGRRLGTSGTTAGALPTLTVARRELAGAEVREIAGILNGTSNLILTRMRERGASFAEALAEAQHEGIAEPDPRYDTEGWDTATKLVILTRALLDPAATLEQVERRGIDAIPAELAARAEETGGRLRLVGRARRDAEGVRVTVGPEVVSPDDPFFMVDGAKKAVRFVSDDFGDLVVMGGASGRADVAAAMLKDMIWAASERRP
jgi:homoserine dehydrogenase